MRTVLLLACMLLAGCATTRTDVIPQVVERRVSVPASLLECMPEPVATGTWRSQRDVALYLVRLAEAGRTAGRGWKLSGG